MSNANDLSTRLQVNVLESYVVVDVCNKVTQASVYIQQDIVHVGVPDPFIGTVTSDNSHQFTVVNVCHCLVIAALYQIGDRAVPPVCDIVSQDRPNQNLKASQAVRFKNTGPLVPRVPWEQNSRIILRIFPLVWMRATWSISLEN